jgi:peroxiredoxin
MVRAFLTLVACAAWLSGSAGQHSGRRAPGFALPDGAFRFYDLQDYRGKILIVDFMQTTCPHCATLSKILENVKTKYAGKVAILSVVTPPDNQATVKQYIAGHKLTYPIVFDCGQMAGSYLSVKGNTSVDLPHIFVIDEQGIIRYDYGYDLLNRDIFEGNGLFNLLDRMIAGQGAAAGAGKGAPAAKKK